MRRMIVCNDCFEMSVQASKTHYCAPRNDKGPYTHVEVGYPSEWEDLLIPFRDTSEPQICGMRPMLYIKVPSDVVRAIIIKHGGLAERSGYLPPLAANRWAAAAKAATLPPRKAQKWAKTATAAAMCYPEAPSDQSTEEEDEDAGFGSPTSAIHLGDPPPPPPPTRAEPTATSGTQITTRAAQVGLMAPPQQMMQLSASPIENSSRHFIDRKFFE